MTLDNWTLYYTTNPSGNLQTTQMVYEPLINPEKNVLCMNFNADYGYLEQFRIYPESFDENFLEFVFRREASYIERFATLPWVPEVIDIETKKRRIFIKWYDSNLSDLLYKSCRQDTNWQTKILKLIDSQIENGIYKLTVYPHSHYLDGSQNFRSIDFYASIDKQNPVLDYDIIKPLLGNSAFRFQNATANGKLDLKYMFIETLKHYHKWPENVFDEIIDSLNNHA